MPIIITVSISEPARFEEAIRLIDEANSADPNSIDHEGAAMPYEVFYSHRLTDWVLRLRPDASEPLRLAARGQHICRWSIPRSSYPMTRLGYLNWRADLKAFHAEKSAEILALAGYGPEVIERVQTLNFKKHLATDPEVQALEDALCLVTLQYQLAALIRKTDPDKMVSILQKTWKKMSPAAHEHALGLSYTPEEQALLAKALGT